ncbi:MAG: aminoacyl-tRNA hydrolase [Candidatus Limivicinus sp.]|jgi:PTH1 family peptidyl-tRNA hydrolase
MIFRKPGAVSWIIAFLGNPGLKYEGTRHNAGFMTGDALAKKKGISINRSRFKALTAQCELGGEKVLLMKPQTYMNLSGEAVAQAVKFYKVPPGHVIVVSDEMALPVGKLRIRKKGSAGGHNGLKSIISNLGTEEFPRIRIGVGEPPHPGYDGADWVLSTFKNQDAEDMAAAAERAAEAAECYISSGAERAMNLYNNR